jgi:alginate O-acetyltransferase complex protein AlgI
MAGTLSPAAPALRSRAPEAQVERSTPDVRRFAMLALQLALLLALFKVYNVEQPAFFSLSCLVFGGFAVAYWLPFRYKDSFVILISLAGAYVLLSPVVASILIATGLVLFAIVRTSLEFRWKVLILLGILSCFAYGRATGKIPLPKAFWPVFGAVFVFRMIVYMYDVKHTRDPLRFKEYLSYFFLLPNYYFLLFPVIDFHTFRKSYFQRDINVVAQQGVWWILRGTTHLFLYRIIYQLQSRIAPPVVPVALAVVLKIIAVYLLYLRVSGQFHIIAGMLHLFGYDLPETNRRYLLANSISDYWRRVNIYWKDFMVKIFYFPAYFKMRRSGELRAQLLATLLVFVLTWFLHAVQFFWLQGKFRVSYNDSLFWIILGTLVMANVWIDSRRRKRLPRPVRSARLLNVLQIAATFTVMAVLWSMWSANSMTEWLAFMRGQGI